jgi:VanZ family protein
MHSFSLPKVSRAGNRIHHHANGGNFVFQLLQSREPCLLCAVSKLRGFVKYWLVIVLWFALIFVASSDTQSSRRSSRIIGPILRTLFPEMPPETVDLIVHLARKCVHLAVFGVLGLLYWRAFRKPVKNDTRLWSWIEARNAVIGVFLYAVTDEVHQAFVPARQGSVWDVILDTLGGALGLLALWGYGRWRKKW